MAADERRLTPILMIGAGGRYAHYVLPALKARGATVKALISSEDKRAEVMDRGPTSQLLEILRASGVYSGPPRASTACST